MSIAHRIRVWYVSLDLVEFIVVNVGKYTISSHESVICSLVILSMQTCLGGGFKYFLDVHPYLGKIPILTKIFQMG